MVHVTAAQITADEIPRLPVMDVEVQAVIDQIAREKSGHQGQGKPWAGGQTENSERRGHDRRAHERGHDQTQGIVGMLVMHSVNQELHPCGRTRLRTDMKNEAMAEVFKQGPEQVSEREGDNHVTYR